jgi:hypothetical protein
MYDEQSLRYAKWNCKYSVIWRLKCCKKSIFGDFSWINPRLCQGTPTV